MLRLLIQKRRRIVKHDEIGYSLWKNECQEKFSLYAIAKVIERIRVTIENSGVHPGIIETRRNQGFVLND